MSHGKGNQVNALQNLSQAFLIAGRPPKAAQPGEVPLDHPPARQERKAAFDVGQLDHRQRNALFGRRSLRGGPGVALVDRG